MAAVKTRTFLFTDIEGSTVLFERSASAYSVARAEHEALLRAVITAHGGVVFRGTGDGVLAAFEETDAALASAGVCQQELAAKTWPPALGALRVRIGLHRGEAEEAGEGDYHGLVMHHATRVLDAGHGGQIVCSETIAAAAGAKWRARLLDLGLYRLRGASAPVRLFQVPHAAAPAAGFPPLRTPAAFTHRLPAPPTRFFGREAELTDLATLLAPESPGQAPRSYGRLVTLLGPGGTGKTRLSLAIADQMLPAYSHAVWFAPLAEIRDAAVLPEALRSALALAPEPGVTPLDQVLAYLRGQPSLLVLDNFEQLVPAGAETVRRLLEGAPQLVCLVSSRIRLELRAEQDFALAPLRLPPVAGSPEELLRYASVQLFCDRARAARRDFQLDEKNAADIAQVCRALEGIPLALELAAARTTVLTPRQVVARLGQRLDFLVGRQQDFADRHRTLRATVAWSYELLSAPLQHSFAQLAVFRGGWTLAAAEAVLAGADADALEQLTELQACSLVIAEAAPGEMRFRMLEVIRDYARERLAGAAWVEAEARHAAFFTQLARDESASDEACRLAALAAEHDNLRALLAGAQPPLESCRTAVALFPFWLVRGFFREGRDCLARLAPLVEDADTRARAAHVMGVLAWKCGDFEDARARLGEALAHWERIGHERNAAAILNNLGCIANERREFAVAADFFARGLAIFRRLDALSESASALSNLGENALQNGELAAARAALEEGLGMQRGLGEQFSAANTLHSLAELYGRSSECERARRAAAECIAIRAVLGAREETASMFSTLTAIALAEHRPELAAQALGAARVALEWAPAGAVQQLTAELHRHGARLAEALGAPVIARLASSGSALALEAMLSPEGAWRPGLDASDAAGSGSPA